MKGVNMIHRYGNHLYISMILVACTVAWVNELAEMSLVITVISPMQMRLGSTVGRCGISCLIGHVTILLRLKPDMINLL